MKRHVDFLSTLYVAWGAIFALVAVAGFALAGGAFAIAESTGPVRFGSEMAARLTGVTITIIALIALVWAILHIVVGRQLKKLRPSARLMALGLAARQPDPVPVRNRARALCAVGAAEGRRAEAV